MVELDREPMNMKDTKATYHSSRSERRTKGGPKNNMFKIKALRRFPWTLFG